MFLLWVAAAVFCFFIYRFAVDVPYMDDYLLLFSITKMTDPATGIAWSDVLTQHNEHRIFLARLVALFDYMIEGHVNFKTLALTGSASVLALFYLLFRLFHRAKVSPWALTPIALLLFQPSYYNNLLWGLSVWQHSVTLAGYILFFWLAMHPTRRMQGLALGLGAVLMYSNSNGLFAWAAVVLLLGCYGRRLEAAVWLATGIGLTLLYYLADYQFYKSPSVWLANPDPIWLMRSLAGFMGGAMYLDGFPWLKGLSSPLLVWLMGIAVLGIYGLAWWEFLFRRHKDYPAVYPVLLGMTIVLVLTGLGAAVTRSNGDLMIIERYQIYSIMCLIIAYSLLVIALGNSGNKWLTVLATAVTALFSFNSYLYYIPELENREKRLLAEAAEIKEHHHSPMISIFLSDPYWNALLRNTIERGILRFPEEADSAFDLVSISSSRVKSPVIFEITKRIDEGVHKTVIDVRHNTMETPTYLLLRSGSEVHLLPAEKEPERSKLRMLQHGSLYQPGTRTSFYTAPLAPGRYQIGLLRLIDDLPHTEWTEQFISR